MGFGVISPLPSTPQPAGVPARTRAWLSALVNTCAVGRSIGLSAVSTVALTATASYLAAHHTGRLAPAIAAPTAYTTGSLVARRDSGRRSDLAIVLLFALPGAGLAEFGTGRGRTHPGSLAINNSSCRRLYSICDIAARSRPLQARTSGDSVALCRLLDCDGPGSRQQGGGQAAHVGERTRNRAAGFRQEGRRPPAQNRDSGITTPNGRNHPVPRIFITGIHRRTSACAAAEMSSSGRPLMLSSHARIASGRRALSDVAGRGGSGHRRIFSSALSETRELAGQW